MSKTTTKAIAKLEDGKRLPDDKVKGLSLRARNGGLRTWWVRYRVGATRREYKIGDYPIIGIADARKIASKLLREVAEGRDPQGELDEARHGSTLEELWQRAWEEHWLLHTKESTRGAVDIAWRIHIRPALGHRVVSDITTSDLATWHAKIGAKGKKGAANRALAYLSKALTLAVKWDYIEASPAKGVTKFKERKMERYLTDEEYRRLLSVLKKNQDSGLVNPMFVAAVLLILFTGLRKSEVVKLRWSEVYLHEQELRLEDTKTGRRTVVISAEARGVLEGLKALGVSSAWVFPGERNPTRPTSGLQHAWEKLRTEAGLEGVRIHDLRHSFASIAAREGHDVLMIQKLLGHKDIATTQRYAHLGSESQRKATQRIGSSIAALNDPDGGEPLPG